jgi:transmembrane sensor
MQQKDWNELLDRYLAGNCTDEEKAAIEQWYLQQVDQHQAMPADPDLGKKGDAILKRIESGIPVQRNPVVFYMRAAAAVLVVALFSAWFIFQERDQPASGDPVVVNSVPDSTTQIKPGQQQAVLVLTDGSIVTLDGHANGLIAKENGGEVRQNSPGELQYAQLSTEATGNAWNKLTTPRGGEYVVVLSDGTKVWLNAESKLEYPVSFAGDKRVVRLEGEAYFEVAKHPLHPFIVQSNNTEVKVLGTHFNVAAYPHAQQEVITTLVEGSVQVKNTNSTKLLSPGFRAVSRNDQHLIHTEACDINEAIAWKNGYFIFRNEPISHIMTRISRWYDVDVKYQGDIMGYRFGGTFSRKKDITELLTNLTLAGNLQFSIDKRQVIVSLRNSNKTN